MEIQRISSISGNLNTMDLDVTQEQLDRYAQGEDLIQHIFPRLKPDEREFLKTGVTKKEWDDMFGSGEED